MSAYLEYFKERVPWARDMDDVSIVEHMSKVTGKPVSSVAQEFGIQPKYGLVPDIKRGFGQAVGSVGSTLQDLGMPDVGQSMENYGRRINLENPSQINTAGDILDKPFTTFREAVGEALPQAGGALAGSTLGRVGGALAGGTLGRVVGGALGLPLGPVGVGVGSTIGGTLGGLLPIAAQSYGGIRQEQREQGIEDRERAALMTVPIAALERLGVEQLATRLGTKGLKNFATDALKEGESLRGYIGRQALKTGLVEGPGTEIPQTALERYGSYKPLTGEEALNEYAIGGTKGFAGGFTIGGAMAPLSLLPESNPAPTPKPTEPPPAPLPRGQMGLFSAEETPPGVLPPNLGSIGTMAPTGVEELQARNAISELLTQRAQFATRMSSAQASQNIAEFYQAQDIVGRIDQQLQQFSPDLVQAVAAQTQAPSTQPGLFGAPIAPVAPVQDVAKTPFFEPPIVLPVIQPQRQVPNLTGENPNAQLILPDTTSALQQYQQAFAKQQTGQLLTPFEAQLLQNPPEGLPAPVVEQGPFSARAPQPTQGELFDDRPLRSNMPPLPPVEPRPALGPAPGQGELFFPNGQPTYAASQGAAPDVGAAVQETATGAGIRMGKPDTKAGTKRRQLLERIEKARMEGRFVGREEQYDDLLNDLAQNVFGRVEKGIAEIEKAPFQTTPTPGASPLAATGGRTIADIDRDMDALLEKGRPPASGVAREAWNDLQRERDALAARVGAPPRPKYVPPKKAAPKEEPKKEAPKKAAPKKEEPKKEPKKEPEREEKKETPPPKTEEPKQEAPPPKQEAPKKEEPKKETKPAKRLVEPTNERWNAMEDRVAYEDLTPESRDRADEANRTGQLNQEEIDAIVEQDRRNKVAAKRAANKPQPESDLEDEQETPTSTTTPTIQQAVSRLTPDEKRRLAAAYGLRQGTAKFFARVKEDVVTYANKGAEAIDAAIRAIVKKIAEGVMAVAVVFNPAAIQGDPSFTLPKRFESTTTVTTELRANVPAAARSQMSADAVGVYEAVAPKMAREGKGFMIADKSNGMLHVFRADGSLISQASALYGKDVGDTMRKTGNEWNRVTPAGKYTLVVEADSAYAGGKVFSLKETYVDNGVVAVHAVYLGTPAEQRLARLASKDPTAKRISYGCINTSNETFLNDLLPNAAELDGGAIFVLPEESQPTAMFTPDVQTETTTTVSQEGTATDEGRQGSPADRREPLKRGTGTVARRKTKADDVPPAVAARTEVEIEAYNPDTEKFEKTKVPADQALESLKDDKDTFQNFVNCLRKGKK